METWLRVVINIAAVAVVIAAAVRLYSPENAQCRQGWASKAVWTVALLFGVGVAGIWIPLGAVFVLRELRRARATARPESVEGDLG